MIAYITVTIFMKPQTTRPLCLNGLKRHAQPVSFGALVLSAAALGACSSPPPKPDVASGEIRVANTDAQALAELVEITRAGLSRRFTSPRAADVRQTLQGWAKTSGMTLHWNSAQTLTTTGVIDEPDIRAAVIALAQQFPSDQGGVLVHFPTPKTMLVKDVLSKDSQAHSCPQVPAGAIVIGQYCLVAQQNWHVEPDDKFLSQTLERWAVAASLNLNWQSKLDWPITLTGRKSYGGDLLSAIAAVTNDLASQGVDFRYVIAGKTLSIHAQPRAQATAQPPQTLQEKETKK